MNVTTTRRRPKVRQHATNAARSKAPRPLKGRESIATPGKAGGISAIVCTKNCAGMVERSLIGLRAAGADEIIVVDAGSHDGTAEIAKKYADRIIYDGGEGLARARQMGAEAAKFPYVAYVGPDNIMPKGVLPRMVADLETEGYVGVQAKTIARNIRSYWDWSAEQNFKIGINNQTERDVIGTPCIFKRDIVLDYEYDPAMKSGCDDTDLCLRLTRDGHRVGMSGATVYEERDSSFQDFYRRWTWYGKGDVEFMRKHKERRLRSITHPLRTYIVKRTLTAAMKGNLKAVPYFAFCGLFRYVGIAKGLMASPK